MDKGNHFKRITSALVVNFSFQSVHRKDLKRKCRASKKSSRIFSEKLPYFSGKRPVFFQRSYLYVYQHITPSRLFPIHYKYNDLLFFTVFSIKIQKMYVKIEIRVYIYPNKMYIFGAIEYTKQLICFIKVIANFIIV